MNKEHIKQNKGKYAGGALTTIAGILIALNSIIDSVQSIADKLMASVPPDSIKNEIRIRSPVMEIISKDTLTTIQKAR